MVNEPLTGRTFIVPVRYYHPVTQAIAGIPVWDPALYQKSSSAQQQVPQELQSRFIDSLYKKYCAMYPPDSNGAIHIGMVRLEVETKKR